jgi:hypothetical protein
VEETHSLLSTIEDLIQTDKIEQAVEELLDFDLKYRVGIGADVRNLSANYLSAKRAYEIQETITRPEFVAAASKTRHALLAITKNLTSLPPTKQQTTQPPIQSPIANPFTDLPNTKLAILYDQQDEERAEQLNKHLTVLKMRKTIEVYNVHQTIGGMDTLAAAEVAMQYADYILLLISSNIFNANAIWLTTTLSALEKGKKVVPIRLDKADLEGTGLEKLRALPSQNRTVTDFANEEQAYSEIVEEVKRLVLKK